nr:DUF5776 domain-containing protein [Lentilactobacillus otakiensis]
MLLQRKKIYLYDSTSFKKANRVVKVQAGTKVNVTAIHKRSTGSYYFETADGRYLTANKNYVQ